MAENFEVLDYMGHKTGALEDRKVIHEQGIWHRSRHVHPVNPAKGTIIFQQRDTSKDVCPGLLDTAAAGHYSPGETADDALREVYEEIGVRIIRQARTNLVHMIGVNIADSIPGELIDVQAPHIQIFEQSTPKKLFNHELQDVSFLVSPLTLDHMELEKDEVYALVEFTVEEIYDLFLQKRNSIRSLLGKKFNHDGSLNNFEQDWTREDFWPTTDNYFGKVADVARRILNGEREFPGI